MRRLLCLLLALASPTITAAQPAPPVAAAPPVVLAPPRMAPFAWLVGEWHGSGWMAGPDGTRHSFVSRETVTWRLSGNALLVEGRHSATGEPDRIVHDAMAMLTWDSRANAYRFHTALANGMGGDYPVTPTANGFTWGIDTPNGRMLYTIAHEDGAWVERGHRAGADGRQVQFFEMTLRKR